MVIFTVISLLIANSGRGIVEEFVETKPIIAVQNHSQSEEANALVEYLQDYATFQEVAGDVAELRDAAFTRDVLASIYIPADFSTQLQNGEPSVQLFANPKSQNSWQIRQILQRFLMFARTAYEEDGRFNFSEVKNALHQRTTVTVLNQGLSAETNFKATWAEGYFRSVAYVLLASIVGVLSMILSDFNKETVRARTRISSLHEHRYFVQLGVAAIGLAISICVIFFIVALAMIGKSAGSIDLPRFALNMIVFSIACMTLSFLINAISNNKGAISGLSTVLSLGFSFISGIFVEVQYLPTATVNLSKIFPMYYYGQVASGTTAGWQHYIKYYLIQLLFAAVFFLLALVIQKHKRQRKELAF